MPVSWFTACTERLLCLLSPPCCAACDAPLAEHGLFCPACEPGESPSIDQLRVDAVEPSPFDGAGRAFTTLTVVATAVYGGSTACAITRLKYGSRPDLARPIAERLCTALRAASVVGPATVVPVPLHPAKLAERGYNQSALIAGHLSARMGFSCRARALGRARVTRDQASLSRGERLHNLSGAIVAREDLSGAHIVLVDDVVTTGATAIACARALVGAGATQVTIAAVARAEPPNAAAR